MDTNLEAVARSLRATLIDGRELVATLTPRGVELRGGRYVEWVPSDATVADFLGRWDRYLEAHGVDVGRRYPTPEAQTYLEARGLA